MAIPGRWILLFATLYRSSNFRGRLKATTENGDDGKKRRMAKREGSTN